MSENVQVAVRVRPFNEREKAVDSACCIRMVNETQQTIITDPDSNVEKVFTFDYSYNSYVAADSPDFASQDTVWNDIGVKVLEHAWNGFNVSLFAYGQTGAGKSFSMVGYGNDKGIIPRASEVIFERIGASTSEVMFKVEASMMEIYNERVKDLFNPSSDNLKVRDHPRQGPYAEGLTRNAVSSCDEINKLMDSGILARTTASTNMNATSSRAHTIFQIVVTQSELNPTTNKVMDKVSRINLIDLAGSERAASTGATGVRLKEGAAINQSLSALGNCISALADIANGKKKQLVPYRNSKLTHLLKDSLGGNSKTIMIAALSPASVNYSETLSTLRYADRAKQIRNQAIVNEDPNQLLIRQLKEELDALRKTMMENMDSSRPQSRESLLGATEMNNVEPPQRQRDPEKEREITIIREQLEEHQRLLQESEKSWQERLKETEELAKKREEQLKVLGLATNGTELKARAMTEPHLLNLNEDQLMSEKLLYFIQDGINKIGRIDADEEQTIIIGGLGILKEHCVIVRSNVASATTCESGKATADPNDVDTLSLRAATGAKIFINGVILGTDKDVCLSHCDRLLLGNSNVFRVVIPTARPKNFSGDDIAKESMFDWQLAMKELNSNQIKDNLELEAQAEKEKQEMDARMKKMEEIMKAEQAVAEEKLQKQREDWEKYVKQLNEDMREKESAIKNQLQTDSDEDKRQLAEQLAQQESKLAEELVKAEISFEKKQEELVSKQRELEETLQKQMREAETFCKQKDRERAERLQFDDQLLISIPLVNEANSIADELQRNTTFSIMLTTAGPAASVLANPLTTIEDDEIAISERISASLTVKVTFQEAGTYRSVMWDIDQFHANIYAMREMYQMFIENNRVVSSDSQTGGVDPFSDIPQPQIIGKGYVYMWNLYYGCKTSDMTPIFDVQGCQCGLIKCEITPTVLSHEWHGLQHRLVETCPDDLGELELPTLNDFLNTNLRINFAVDSLRGIPGKLCKDAYVVIKWSEQDEDYTSLPASSASVDPVIDFNIVIEKMITPELVNFIRTHPVEIDVYGIVPSSNLNKVVSQVIRVPTTSVDDTESSTVTFIDADRMGRNRLVKNKSTRRRRGENWCDEGDLASTLDFYKEQLSVQEKTLADNTLELEARIHEVSELEHQLSSTVAERDRLRDALEGLARTNKLLQTRLEQQIIRESVSQSTSTNGSTIEAYNSLGDDRGVAQTSITKPVADINALIQRTIFEDVDSDAPKKYSHCAADTDARLNSTEPTSMQVDSTAERDGSMEKTVLTTCNRQESVAASSSKTVQHAASGSTPANNTNVATVGDQETQATVKTSSIDRSTDISKKKHKPNCGVM